MLRNAILAAFASLAVFAGAPAGAEALALAPNVEVANCTAEQKTKAQRAAAAYARAIPAARRAYFRTHKSAGQRRAFVRAQQAKLRRLRVAAACALVVPPPPLGPTVVPAAASPCMLAPNQRSTANELNWGFPLFHEGPLHTAGALPTAGQVRALVVAVDFSDAPAGLDAAQLAATAVSGLGRFEEYSYGRFSASAQIVTGWRRMPRPASSYASLSDGGDGARVFFTEVTGLVDAEVDFSTIDFVFVLAPGMAPYQRAGNPAWSVFPGRGFTRDGKEIRHATTMMRAFTQAHQDIASVANHELAHSLGLPESYRQTSTGTSFDLVGMWDLMSEPNQHHFLAWHKYRLGWIEQSQVTCLDAAGQVQVTLTPVETPRGMKAVVVRTGASNAYVVEVRRKIGLDANICREGVLVYTVDSQVDNGGGPIRVQRAAEDLPGEERQRCGTLYNAPFDVGQTFEDASVRVTVVRSSGSDYAVEVVRK
jgi:M6 family metalloprotease-like protein